MRWRSHQAEPRRERDGRSGGKEWEQAGSVGRWLRADPCRSLSRSLQLASRHAFLARESSAARAARLHSSADGLQQHSLYRELDMPSNDQNGREQSATCMNSHASWSTCFAVQPRLPNLWHASGHQRIRWLQGSGVPTPSGLAIRPFPPHSLSLRGSAWCDRQRIPFLSSTRPITSSLDLSGPLPGVTARHHLRIPFPLPLAKMLAAALLGLSIGCLVGFMMPGPMSEAERRRHLAAAAAEARVAARGSVGTEARAAEQPVPPGSVGAEAGAAERQAARCSVGTEARAAEQRQARPVHSRRAPWAQRRARLSGGRTAAAADRRARPAHSPRCRRRSAQNSTLLGLPPRRRARGCRLTSTTATTPTRTQAGPAAAPAKATANAGRERSASRQRGQGSSRRR